MMNKGKNERIAWVTDSTGFLDEELKASEGLSVVPINIRMEGKDYIDGVDITHDDIYEAMENRGAEITTSQPSVGQFLETYQKLAEQKYDRIISFLLSEKLSGTVSSSIQAGQLAAVPVHTFDSRLLSYPMTYIMKKAIGWHKTGASVAEILDRAARLRDSNETYVLIGNLNQLYKSGRLGSIKYYLGSFLRIKPIVSLVEGSLEIQDIARSEGHAEKIIFGKLKHAVEKYQITDCMILHGQFRKQAEEWAERIKSLYPELALHVYPLGTAIGLHTGGSTLGISWFKEKI